MNHHHIWHKNPNFQTKRLLRNRITHNMHTINSTVILQLNKGDCEGCQEEKKENEKLVEFYNRLDKMSTKVKKFRNGNRQAKDTKDRQGNEEVLNDSALVTGRK